MTNLIVQCGRAPHEVLRYMDSGYRSVFITLPDSLLDLGNVGLDLQVRACECRAEHTLVYQPVSHGQTHVAFVGYMSESGGWCLQDVFGKEAGQEIAHLWSEYYKGSRDDRPTTLALPGDMYELIRGRLIKRVKARQDEVDEMAKYYRSLSYR